MYFNDSKHKSLKMTTVTHFGKEPTSPYWSLCLKMTTVTHFGKSANAPAWFLCLKITTVAYFCKELGSSYLFLGSTLRRRGANLLGREILLGGVTVRRTNRSLDGPTLRIVKNNCFIVRIPNGFLTQFFPHRILVPKFSLCGWLMALSHVCRQRT